MPELIDHSLNVILGNQQPSGAYPACPTMPDYQYSWFRDGSFIAHAAALYGKQASAMAFHRWASGAILRNEEGARRAMADYSAGRVPDQRDVLRARYTYDGGNGPDDWPEFQLDGLGTWLWSLKQIADSGQALDADICRAAELVADYLSVLWAVPCNDLWEEFGTGAHTYTFGAIYGGLQAASALLNRSAYAEVAAKIRHHIMGNGVNMGGTFIKSVGADLVDGSLTGLATPYRVVDPGAPLMQATVARIKTDLYTGGIGVHRYRGDSYYGGGAWLLLEAWLGWYEAECGNFDAARLALANVEKHATQQSDMPEQLVPPMLTTQADYDHWINVRGSIATPLLWSHAMYLILAKACTV